MRISDWSSDVCSSDLFSPSRWKSRSRMKNWVSRRTLAFAVAVIAAAIPALGQEGPESLLPPGFGPPAPSRPVAPAVPSAPAPATEGQAEAAPAAELPDEATASRSEEHTSELQSQMRTSDAIF